MTERAPEPAAVAAPPRGVFGGAAWRLGRISGIEIAIDHSWLLIFALITFSLRTRLSLEHESWSAGQAWGSAVVTSLLFFASILLHELGHSLTAQGLGLRVKSITLFVFGGVAQLSEEPHRPRDEILIAAAGPLVSVGLAIAFGAAGGLFVSSDGLAELVASQLVWLSRINLVLAIFNCVPGFPLDGGRVLRGIVWAITGSFERATSIAATSGSIVAYGLILLGIFQALVYRQFVGGLWLAFIGWFLLNAARASVSQVVIQGILSRIQAGRVMESVQEACVTGAESVTQLTSNAVLLHGRRTFYVVDRAGSLAGLVTLGELAEVPIEERAGCRVDDVMLPLEQLAIVEANESAWVALRRMTERGVNQLPVLMEGRLVGAVTRERLLGVVQASLALREGGS